MTEVVNPIYWVDFAVPGRRRMQKRCLGRVRKRHSLPQDPAGRSHRGQPNRSECVPIRNNRKTVGVLRYTSTKSERKWQSQYPSRLFLGGWARYFAGSCPPATSKSSNVTNSVSNAVPFIRFAKSLLNWVVGSMFTFEATQKRLSTAKALTGRFPHGGEGCRVRDVREVSVI